jgi:hypothetical protein
VPQSQEPASDARKKLDVLRVAARHDFPSQAGADLLAVDGGRAGVARQPQQGRHDVASLRGDLAREGLAQHDEAVHDEPLDIVRGEHRGRGRRHARSAR